MALADPASINVTGLFRDDHMFDSRRSWSDAGFQVVDRSNNGKIMVAAHPSVQGLLFKKYSRDIDEKEQTKNFERRIEGAKRLRDFIDKQQLSRVVVPRKWMLDLGRGRNILVVEQFDLRDNAQTKAAYQQIDPDLLRELCAVLFHFRGMDSSVKNLPFCADGQIAFIDTEHWDRGSSKDYLHQVGEYLASDRRKFAEKIFDQLEDESKTVGDFTDEEDTSSSSSSWSS
jgi:hypothetical protein